MSKNKGMHPEDIKAAIRKSGTTMESLSTHWGYDSTAIATCLKRPWPAVQELVASHLCMKPQGIWPDRYNADGTPKATIQSVDKSNKIQTPGNSENQLVA